MHIICLAGFEVSAAVLLRFQILWDLHGSRSQRRNLLSPLTLKVKVVSSFRVSVDTNTVALCQILKDTDSHLPSLFSYSFYKYAFVFGMMSVYLSLYCGLTNSTQQSFLRS